MKAECYPLGIICTCSSVTIPAFAGIGLLKKKQQNLGTTRLTQLRQLLCGVGFKASVKHPSTWLRCEFLWPKLIPRMYCTLYRHKFNRGVRAWTANHVTMRCVRVSLHCGNSFRLLSLASSYMEGKLQNVHVTGAGGSRQHLGQPAVPENPAELSRVVSGNV